MHVHPTVVEDEDAQQREDRHAGQTTTDAYGTIDAGDRGEHVAIPPHTDDDSAAHGARDLLGAHPHREQVGPAKHLDAGRGGVVHPATLPSSGIRPARDPSTGDTFGRTRPWGGRGERP